MAFLVICHFLNFHYICLLHVCIHAHDTWVYVWRSENSFAKSVLSSQVGPGDGTQVITLGGKHLYLLSHPVGSDLSLDVGKRTPL